MRYKCICHYDGRSYSGFQRQKNAKTIQGEIEKTLKKIYNQTITIHPASRTDKGVHALGQVFHYDTDIEISADKLATVINCQLAKDIYITHVEKVDLDFHARYQSKGKTYHYKLSTAKTYNVFTKDYCYQYNRGINIDAMQALSHYFIGKYDFKAFMASGSDKENTTRTIYNINFDYDNDILVVSISGDGFLYNMVRIIVGLFLDYSEGSKDLEAILYHFKKGDRQFFKRTAPACGLYLVKTQY